MHALDLEQLSTVVGGAVYGENVSFTRVSTDTRSIRKGDLFFALKGENFDANTFVGQAKNKGAVAAVVSQAVDDLPSVLVPDTTKALAMLAAAERLKVDIPVIAITGSNGKTSVKEMLVAILSQSFSVLATQGNLNNHIGVPLTLLDLNAKHQVAVIEMGASHVGEIAYLCQLAKPDFAVINNIGDAHLEGFGSIEGIARAKAEIISGLSASGVAILNREDAWFDSWMEQVAERRVVSFGWSDRATVWVQQEDVRSRLLDGQFETVFRLHYLQESIDIHCSLLGEHNVLNSMAAASVAIALGVSLADVSTGLAAVKPVRGRMEPLKGLCDSLIINDCYNASPNSFKEALKCVLGLNKPVWLVLGDFAELGDSSADIHRTLGGLIAETDVLRVFAVGKEMKRTVEAINEFDAGSSIQALHFSSKGKLSNTLLETLTKDVVVLVKGSRSQGLEEVVEQLVEKEGMPCC